MLREFVSWLDDYLLGQGPPAIAKAVLGILSVAALPGAVFGSLFIKSAALLVAVFAVTSLGLVLLADRRSMRRELEEHKELVTRYCSHIRRSEEPFYQIVGWEQESVITDDRGGTNVVVKVRIKVLGDDALFFRVALGCGWAQPARCRRGVKVEVRSLLVDDKPGATLRKTMHWKTDGKFHLYVHFDSPPAKDSEISLVVDLKWPMMCQPLMVGKHQPDFFTVRLAGALLNLSYTVVLPRGRDAYFEPVGFTDQDGSFKIKRLGDAESGSRIRLKASGVGAHRRVGMKLELK
ncbi:hypothetical protein ACSHWB_23905 [Lentzea sp. HUAS TT2]|uniref:hypothetical protein n=1 Tax=Lentzea sp. HUAS TT2 TaxID=3447454 RepID=UPI003F6F5A4E